MKWLGRALQRLFPRPRLGAPAHIKPCMNPGLVLVHDDGKTFEVAPFQVFYARDGGLRIRIGRNMIFFQPDGCIDGTESQFEGEHESIVEALNRQHRSYGRPPAAPYFPDGTRGRDEETADWHRKVH